MAAWTGWARPSVHRRHRLGHPQPGSARWAMIDNLWKPGWASFGYMRAEHAQPLTGWHTVLLAAWQAA